MRFKKKGSRAFDGIEGTGINLGFTSSLRKKLHVSLGFAAWLFLFAVFPSTCIAESITLAWDANTEPDIAGYKVYYRTGSSGSQIKSLYNGIGMENGDSPIEMPVYEDENLDPRFAEITLCGLDEEKNYYFVVTAYNTEGLESAPSNEASLVRAVATGDSLTESESSTVSERSMGGESSTGSGSVESHDLGGGGGGCFICSVRK